MVRCSNCNIEFDWLKFSECRMGYVKCPNCGWEIDQTGRAFNSQRRNMEKFLKVIRAEVKDINTEKHTLTAVISTKKTDRDGDIVDPEAFKKRIKYYKDHPVLLSSHNYSDLRKQIGRSTNVTIDENEVTSTFEYFVDKGNPEADWAWVLAQKGIASFSIGFMGHSFDWLKEKDAEGNEHITGRKFTDIELLEVSQVLVPSNRGALQSGLALAQEEASLCELAIKSFDNGELKIDIKQESTHYSDELLGKEGQAPISEPKSKELGIEDIKNAVNTAVTQLKEKK